MSNKHTSPKEIEAIIENAPIGAKIEATIGQRKMGRKGMGRNGAWQTITFWGTINEDTIPGRIEITMWNGSRQTITTMTSTKSITIG